MDNPKTEKEKTLSMPNTPVTLGSLQYEVAHLKELLFTRIIAIEHGIQVAHDDFVRFPTEVDKRIGSTERFLGNRIDHVDEYFKLEIAHIQEKFGVVEKIRCEQNENLNKYLKEQKEDNISNLVTALNAKSELSALVNANHKEAMNKSEAYYSKQIDMIIQTQQAGFNVLKDSITEIKVSLGQGMGKETGKGQQLAIFISVGVAIISMLVMFLLFYRTATGR